MSEVTTALQVCPDCNGEGGYMTSMYGDDWEGESCDTCRTTGWVEGTICVNESCDDVLVAGRNICCTYGHLQEGDDDE